MGQIDGQTDGCLTDALHLPLEKCLPVTVQFSLHKDAVIMDSHIHVNGSLSFNWPPNFFLLSGYPSARQLPSSSALLFLKPAIASYFAPRAFFHSCPLYEEFF